MAKEMQKETPKKKGKWVNVGEILKSKEGKSYIRISTDVVLKKDMNLVLTKKSDDLDFQVENGYITAERAEELKEKLSFITHVIKLPPQEE